ncbi:MAG: type IV toxin-antitoxin system AbiEi family antitoxin [Proteobacteria bacterium]|jgi:predicted transcriptional regulator of viral defense system|nr:type IV toxin-antitoxin system AbiEi family antitoxin [Pseudomonadota bacterium]MDQ1345187.1 AbiEi 1 protein [Pseudomonadota bacterium]
MRARGYIEELAANGRHHFRSVEAFQAIGGSQAAVRAQLRRLKEQGLIAEPARSFHVIVPPEYRRLRCLPAEQFVDQLMKVGEEPYYVGLLSAAERHGAAHQRPQSCQVMVRKNRAALSCGEVRVEFIARGDLEKMPVATVNTPRGVLRYATPEVTALELVGYPKHAGGLSNVATVVAELAEGLDAGKLLEVARLSPISWSQRLGYLLELVGREDIANAIQPFVQEQARSYTPLRRTAAIASAKRSAKWKLIINAEVEPEAVGDNDA